MAEEFLLTTANNLEGYVVVKQYGLVFGETVFKNSALDQLGAGISNIIDSLRFKATEMAGQMDLIETARDYAYNKLIEAAKRKGANAVIAIDSDNTIGMGNVMYISLYGTAVKVVTIEEFEEHKRTEEENRIKEEEKKKKQEEMILAIKQRRENNDASSESEPEEIFLKAIEDCSSMMDIWKPYLWSRRLYLKRQRCLPVRKGSCRHRKAAMRSVQPSMKH